MNDAHDPDEDKLVDVAVDVATLLAMGTKILERQTTELEQARIGNAKVVHALDCALQLVETLIAFLPEGQPLHPGLDAAKGALDQALKELRR